MRDRQKDGDRGFAMLWAFNLSKWHQGLQPACLIILKLNVGQRMTQTCVFIKACLGFGSFVFMQHTLLMSMLHSDTTLLLVVAYFMTLREGSLELDLLRYGYVFDLWINYMVGIKKKVLNNYCAHFPRKQTCCSSCIMILLIVYSTACHFLSLQSVAAWLLFLHPPREAPETEGGLHDWNRQQQTLPETRCVIFSSYRPQHWATNRQWTQMCTVPNNCQPILCEILQSISCFSLKGWDHIKRSVIHWVIPAQQQNWTDSCSHCTLWPVREFCALKILSWYSTVDKSVVLILQG